MKDAVKRTISRISLYFKRRKVLKEALNNWADTLINQQEAMLRPAIAPIMQAPVPAIDTQTDKLISNSVDELIMAMAAEPTQAPATAERNLKMDIINRRIGA